MQPENIEKARTSDAEILVVGGGPSGMMAAAAAAGYGENVCLLEKNEKLGKKLFITGHGRCNVTNVSGRDAYERSFFRNAKFLRSAFSAFGPQDTIALLEAQGVPVKQEDSGRIFPRSDKSSDVIAALNRALKREGVRTELDTRVQQIVRKSDGSFAVRTPAGTYNSLALVLATGGMSYPSTGSTGDGFTFAHDLGHSLIPEAPGLCGLVALRDLSDLQGLTARDVSASLYIDSKRLAEERGDLLFTRSGLSGPVAMRLSCSIPPGRASDTEVRVNLRPRFTGDQLRVLLQKTIQEAPNREVGTLLQGLLPKRLAAAVAQQASVESAKKGNQLTKQERQRLTETIQSFRVPLAATRPLEEAIITLGGVNVREVLPSTMESRLVPGLFFAGELLDIGAMTGGYNIQAALSTGFLAGRGAAAYVQNVLSGKNTDGEPADAKSANRRG